MIENIQEWQYLVTKIREWDRREHNWAVTNKTVNSTIDHKNLQSQEHFIRSLMEQFELKKKNLNK